MISRIFVLLLAVSSTAAQAGELEGPGRFCGYSPIIDLIAGEKVTTLEEGIHGGSFKWEGQFGKLIVYGLGWASRPQGKVKQGATARGHTLFAERRLKGVRSVAIWNGKQGAAYFSSPSRLSAAQFSAIDRVDLFQEGEHPEGCKLRTIFVWE